MKQPYKKHMEIFGAIAFITFAMLVISILGQSAHAEIYNPHPAPTNNSITSAMIKTGAVIPSKTSTTDTYSFAGILNGLITSADGIFTSSLTAPASTTFNGVGYKWSSSQGSAGTALTNDGAGNLSWSKPASGSLSSNFTAGENINKGDAVSLGSSSITVPLVVSVANNSAGTILGTGYNHSAGVVITTPANMYGIKSFTFAIEGQGGAASTPNIAINIYPVDVNGIPTSPVIASTTLSISATNVFVTQTFSFPQVVPLLPNTQYALVIINNTQSTEGFMINSTNAIDANYVSATTAPPTTAWSYTMGFIYNYVNTNPSYVYQSNSTNAGSSSFINYFGIAQTSALSGVQVNVAFNGISTASTTLATGTSYYLTNTAGLISPTAGTNSKKVGYALSSGKLLIIPSTF